MNKAFSNLNSIMIKSVRGRSAQVSLNKDLLKTNYDGAILDIGRKYEQFLKLNSLTKLPVYSYPKQANRLMEVKILRFIQI